MLSSILTTLAPLCWVFILLTLLVFAFSLVLVQIATGHLFDTEGEPLFETEAVRREALADMFGSMTDALYTLFQAVTGGLNWGVVNAPLIDIHWAYGVVFALYIFLFVFAASNVVTGVFVEKALRSAQAECDDMIHSQLEGTNSAYSLLKKRLEAADENGSGTLAVQELESLLQDESVRAHLQRMGLEVHEAWGLCRLLDCGISERVSISEFMLGCIRLKSSSRSVDVATMMYENKRMLRMFRCILENKLDKMHQLRSEMGVLTLPTLHDLQKITEHSVAAAGAFTPVSPRERECLPETPGNSEGGSPRPDEASPANHSGLDLLSTPASRSSGSNALGVPPVPAIASLGVKGSQGPPWTPK